MSLRLRKHAGFTLLEVLVAMVVLGVLTVFMAQGLRAALGAWELSDREATRGADLQAAVNVLRRAIQGAYPAFANSEPDDRRITFEGTADELILIAPLPSAVAEGVMAWERFYVAEDGASHALFANWQLDLPPIPENGGGEQRVRLAHHVKAIRFQYFGPAPDDTAPRWQDRWTDRTALPLLVRVLIEPERSGRWPSSEIVVHPRVTANTACLFDTVALDCQKVR